MDRCSHQQQYLVIVEYTSPMCFSDHAAVLSMMEYYSIYNYNVSEDIYLL